ncbi:MAG: penicillin-binding protein 2, partial [Candidatus Porifericomitaceae bacterium WSBS_2022_MAG_OTU9]
MSSATRLFGTESQAEFNRSAILRIRLMAFALLVLFLFIGERLFVLQVLHHSRYSTLARENHVRVEPVPPPRGRIYSSDNVLLAGNLPSYDMILRSEYLDRETEQRFADELQNILPELDLKAVLRSHRQSSAPDHEPVLLWSGLDDTQLAMVKVRQHNLPGLDVVTSSRRFYPLHEVGMHLIGYVSGVSAAEYEDQERGRDFRIIGSSGRAGIERKFEDWLRGTPGSNNIEVDASGRSLRILDSSMPQPGSDIHLSVDASLQLDAYHALEGRRGAVVAIDVASGLVRALVSSPATDPNVFIVGARGSAASSVKKQQGSLFHRALAGQYPPGSTIKPFFALAGLHYGAKTVGTSLWCNGSFTLAASGDRYRDWKAHGEVDLLHSIEASCDVFYYKLALELGVERSSKFLRIFGFGSSTDVGLLGEKGGLVPDDAWKRKKVGERWYQGDTVSYGIGQSYLLVTPMQLAVATATLFSDSGKVRPVLLQDGSVAADPAPLRQINNDHIQIVRDGMLAVVHGSRGTARAQSLSIDFEIAGKTGTAQVVRLRERDNDEPVPEKEQDHS